MNYEKAYNEALERFKAFKEKYYTKDICVGDVLFDKTGEMQKDFESIFPQPQESEDERIRKEIIHYILYKATDVSEEQEHAWISYLEKQKEQKKLLAERFRPDFPTVADFIESVEEQEKDKAIEILEDYLKWAVSSEEECRYTWKELANAIRLGIDAMKEKKPNIEPIQKSWYMEGYHDRKFNNEPKWIIKTGEGGPRYEENPKYGQHIEQKPTEWNEEIIRKAVKEVGLTQHQIDWFKTNVFLPKQEWNEEDESYLQTVINEMEANKKEAQEYEHKNYDAIISWLKYLPLSLKKRNEDVAKLCSNEWSEEDEKMLVHVVELLELNCDFSEINNEISWLKSLSRKKIWNKEDERILKGIVGLIDHNQHYDVSNKDMLNWLKSLKPQPKQE